MKRKLTRYTIFVCLCLSGIVSLVIAADENQINQDENGPQYAPGELIIKLNDDNINLQKAAGMRTLSQMENRQDFETENIIPKENLVLISVDEGADLSSEIQRLSQDPNVEYVQPNYAYEILISSPNDTRFSKQWALNNVWQYADVDPYFWVPWSGTAGADIDRLRAMDIRSWDGNPLTTGTTVAVIDVGFEYTHTDLASHMRDGTNCLNVSWAARWWCIGWWFDAYTLSKTGVTWFHGTYVAGIIWAVTNNNFGVAGVNPNARLMNLNASHGWYIYSFAAAYAISFAKYNWAKILNLSRWSQRFNTRSNPDPTVYNAIKEFPWLVAIAAGNRKTEHVGDYYVTPADFAVDTPYRSGLDNVISVWWSSQWDTLVQWSTYGSDYGTIISISAPACVWTLMTSNGTDWSCGTSFSSPHVAGALSLLRSMKPELSYLQIKNALLNNAESIPALIGKFYNGRRLNVFNALQFLYVQQISGLNIYTDGTKQQSINSWSYLAGTSSYIEWWLSNISWHVSTYNVVLSYSGMVLETTGTTETGITLNLSGDGQYQVTITPVSSDKNLTWGILTWSFLADTTTPTANIIYAPISGNWTSGNVVVTLTGRNENLYNINTTWYTFTDNWTFTFTFSDIGGNTGSVIATVDWIDNNPPVFSGVVQSGVYTTGIRISFFDVETGITATVNGLPYTNNTLITWDEWATFAVTDALGNWTWVTFLMNTTLPMANITYSSASGNRTSGDVIATLTGWNKNLFDINTLWYTFTENWSFTFTFSDIGWQTGSAIATVNRIDKIPPTASIMYSNTWSYVIATLTGISEPLTWYNALSRLFTSNGTYIFTFKDLAGNTGSVIATVVLPSQWTTNITWSAYIGWATTTGATFAGTGMMNILWETSNDYLQIPASGLVISSTVRNGILLAPNLVASWSTGSAEFSDAGLPAQTQWTTTRTILMTVQVGASNDSLVATGWFFTVSFVVPWGTNSSELKIYRSADGIHWEANNPDPSCPLNSSLVCSFRTNHLSYFTTIKETSTWDGWWNQGWNGGGWWWGGWWWTIACTGTSLICSGGIYVKTSTATCEGGSLGMACTTTWNVWWTGSVSGDIIYQLLSPLFSLELNEAYAYAYKIGITTASTIQKANMEWTLIRQHLAKMISQFAINVLHKKPNTALSCHFEDMEAQGTEMIFYAKLACQLWLMGVDTKNKPVASFNPNTEVTRAQFGTVLSRALRGTKYNGWKVYFTNHLNALKKATIMKNISNPLSLEVRGYVMLMMMRSAELK